MPETPLIGRWRLVEDTPGRVNQLGFNAMEFTRFGEMVASTIDSSVVIDRKLLTYRVEGNFLFVNRPSTPGEQHWRFLVTDNRLLLGNEPNQVVLVQEDPHSPSDSLAYSLAIGNTAIIEGLNAAHDGRPFIPFLISDTGKAREIIVFVTDSSPQTSQELRNLAQERVREISPKVCAFVYDGYVTSEGSRLDAVVVEVSQLGLTDGLLLCQPYRFEANQTIRAGRISMKQNPSWL